MSDSSDEDGPSEATMLFAEEVTKEFKKAFPLKSETLKKQQIERNRRTPAVCKRLNFDETMSPSFMEVEVKTARANYESLERQLSMKIDEIQRLNSTIMKKDDDISRLMNERYQYRMERAQLEEDMRTAKYTFNEQINDSELKLEKWETIGKKYYTWFNIAKSQLEEVQELEGDDWENPEKVDKINQKSREFFNFIGDIEFTDDFVDQLASGSIQSFSGVEFKAKQPLKKEVVRGADVLDSSCFKAPENNTVLEDTNVSFSNSTFNSSSDITLMTGGGRANVSSIEYEKDEKIQRLLLENSVLKDSLKISKGRSDRSLIVEERNRSLEIEKDALQNRLDQTFGEIEAMRIGQARKIFNIDTGLENSEKYLRLIDRINGLLLENNRLEKEFEAATSRITRMDQDLRNAERRNSHLEDVYSNQIGESRKLQRTNDDLQTKCDELEDDVEQLTRKLSETEQKVEETERKVEEAERKVKEAERKVEEAEAAASSSSAQNVDSTIIAPPPTDAGNSTQILHMATNPLHIAHAEFQDQETKKRKLSELDGTEDPEAKRQRQEKIEELEEQLRMCEREKNVIEDSYKLHKDLANKFRQVCIALTGLQIKLKDADEGICTVQSEYVETNQAQFVFKCFYGTTRIDMLDVNSESSTEMIRKWEPFMKKYIGDRNSIPAFLAAVTLQMEKDRDFDETMHERTHTFSVCHED